MVWIVTYWVTGGVLGVFTKERDALDFANELDPEGDDTDVVGCIVFQSIEEALKEP